MLDVYIDRACAIGGEPRLQTLNPFHIDAAHPAELGKLAKGGVLMLGVRTADGGSALASIRAVRREHPHVVIILAADDRNLRRVPRPQWTLAGVDEFVGFAQEQDVAEVVSAIRRRTAAPPPAEELRQLPKLYSWSRAVAAVLHAFRNGNHELRAAELACRYGVSPRTVRDRMSDLGIPSPDVVCRVGLWLRVAELRDRGVESAAEWARRLGFDDSTQVRQSKSWLRKAVESGRNSRLGVFAQELPRLLSVLGLVDSR